MSKKIKVTVDTPGIHVGDNWYPKGSAKYKKAMKDKKKAAKLPVIFRVHGKRTKAPASRGDLVAIFPSEAGTNSPNTMSCYCPIGQHSTCDSGYSGERTRPATKEEAKRLMSELRAVGYKSSELKVIKRPSSHHRDNRVKQIKR